MEVLVKIFEDDVSKILADHLSKKYKLLPNAKDELVWAQQDEEGESTFYCWVVLP